jgi:lipopolysaccharide export LptBFGC system permease protein LptF
MKSHKRKMVAPILVTVITAAYYVVYFGFLMWIIEGVFKLLLGIIPIAFIILTVSVCIDRIKEIKKGEEDDLSKY